MKLFKIIPTTYQVDLAGIAPSPAIQHLPDWYKKIPPYMNGDKKLRFPMENLTHNTTVKRCIPFLDAITAGYTFVLNDDVFIEQTLQGPLIRWKSDAEVVTWHSLEQFKGLPVPHHHHNMVAKWHNDYVFKTPPGYSLWCTHPVNRFDLPFTTVSGFVDTDSYVIPVQFPFFLKEGFEGIIESGTPVAQLIPIKRESWKREIKSYNEKESYKGLRAFKRTFVDSYKKNFWSKKSYS